MRVTDDNCLGCCLCPDCGGQAHWSLYERRHACADPDCAKVFREHDDTQFEQDDDTDGD